MPNNYILTSEGNFISEDELYHYGVKGQKWGVRRYQNKDGSLTNSGKSKYSTMYDAKEAYEQAKQKTSKAKRKVLVDQLFRSNLLEKNRTRYSKDVQSYNNSIVGLDKAKYDYKIAKAEQKGKMDKASKLRAKRDLNIKKIKARASISNAYIKDTYEKQNAGKLIFHKLFGGNKGTINALIKSGVSEKGAKYLSYVFNDSYNMSSVLTRSDRNIERSNRK